MMMNSVNRFMLYVLSSELYNLLVAGLWFVASWVASLCLLYGVLITPALL